MSVEILDSEEEELVRLRREEKKRLERAAALDAVKALIAALEAHPEIPLPSDWAITNSEYSRISFGVGYENYGLGEESQRLTREAFAAVLRALPVSKWEKKPDTGDEGAFRAYGHTHGGLRLHVYAERNAICERRIVGTETVEIPDPDAPTVSVDREIVEWVCHPVMANEATEPEAAAS